MTLGLNGKLAKFVFMHIVIQFCQIHVVYVIKKKTSIKRDNLMYSEKMIRVSPTDPSH